MDKDQVKEILESIKASADEKFETKAEVETKIETKADKAELEAVKEAIEAVTAKFDSIPAIVNKNEERSLELKSVNEAFVKSFEETGKYTAEICLKSITETAVTGAPKVSLGLTGAEFAANPVRNLARKFDVSSGNVSIPRKTGDHGANVANSSNKGSAVSGSAAVEELTILAKTIRARSDITIEAAADIIGFDQYWSQDMLDEVAVKEAQEHVSAIEGLTNSVTAAAATELSFDDFGNLIFSVAPQYRQNGVLMVSTAAMQSLRTLNQSGTGSDLLFDPQTGNFRLFGYQVVENGYMAGVEENATVAAFGNFAKGLTIIDRETATVGRNPFTEPGHWTYYAQMRSGIGEVDTNALRKMVMAAS